MEGSRCFACHRKLTGTVVEVQSHLYHENCFTCTQCDKILSNCPFKLHDDVPYCEEHYYERFGKRCDDCGQIIQGLEVTALGKSYHKEHFRCWICKTPFPTTSFLKKEFIIDDVPQIKPICRDCYTNNFAEPCYKCGKGIGTENIVAMGRSWHPDCFRCAHCNNKLDSSMKFIVIEGQPWCINCSNSKRTSDRLRFTPSSEIVTETRVSSEPSSNDIIPETNPSTPSYTVSSKPYSSSTTSTITTTTSTPLPSAPYYSKITKTTSTSHSMDTTPIVPTTSTTSSSTSELNRSSRLSYPKPISRNSLSTSQSSSSSSLTNSIPNYQIAPSSSIQSTSIETTIPTSPVTAAPITASSPVTAAPITASSPVTTAPVSSVSPVTPTSPINDVPTSPASPVTDVPTTTTPQTSNVTSTRTYTKTVTVTTTEAILCPNCNTPHLANATECSNCGYKFNLDINEYNIIQHKIKSIPDEELPIYPYSQLISPPYPANVDNSRRECHLAPHEFQQLFGYTHEDYKRLPQWKQKDLKKKLHLF